MSNILKLIFIAILFFVTTLEAKNYLLQHKIRFFVDDLVKNHKLDRAKLTELFSDVAYQQTALSFYNKDIKAIPEKCDPKRPKTVCYSKGSWDRYSHNLLKSSKVQKGKAYMMKHHKILNRAYQKYGVPPEYITAIIGIESHYGANTGKYPVFDTLATLAFEPNRRNDFFRAELIAFLKMTQREKVEPAKVKGSYAGAIGLGQFMPSNYKSLAIDFNRDGKVSLNSHADAIGSIAHYFKKSGWKKDEEVAIPLSFLGHRYFGKKTGYKYKYTRSSLPELKPKEFTTYNDTVYLIKLQRATRDELWYGTKNFYAITRYNHSDYYAMAVHQLAQKIAGKSTQQSNIIENGFVNNYDIKDDGLNNYLDAPLRGRKFIIDL